MATLQGNEVATNKRYTQVYMATHEGENILPFMKRSFISFSFGGKNIEEFNLIATISGDRMSRPGYTQFEDTVSSYSNLDGEQYWSTHYKANQMEFILATDGIEQRVLDDFLYWFRAGETKELILAEHPNRAILARVSQPPQLNLLPFEEKVNVPISNFFYETSTTLYKGEITLNLVMEDPHWYAITNILGTLITHNNKTYYENIWTHNGQQIDIFQSKDALKILYEDGIPLGSMINRNMILGNGAYADVEKDISSLIWDPNSTIEITNYEELSGGGAVIDDEVSGTGKVYTGRIAGSFVNVDDEGIVTLDANTQAYFYYSGTAPSPVELAFTITPTFNNEGYISVPSNNYSKNNDKPYDTITVVGQSIQEFRITTPNIFTSYNKAVNIIKENITNQTTLSWEDLYLLIRNNVHHAKVRAWVIHILDIYRTNNANIAITSANASTIINNMKPLFMDENKVTSARFIFKSKTGEAIGYFNYKDINNILLVNQEEDVGDMIYSNYIILRDRNKPTDVGFITSYTSEHPEYSHYLVHNIKVPLEHLLLLYKNMYL